jgi:hypothetical protein
MRTFDLHRRTVPLGLAASGWPVLERLVPVLAVGLSKS